MRDSKFLTFLQEINEMLGARMSNQEEDEVEDELEAMAAEMAGTTLSLPSIADQGLVDPMPDAPSETPKERARRRAKERETETGAEPMLA